MIHLILFYVDGKTEFLAAESDSQWEHILIRALLLMDRGLVRSLSVLDSTNGKLVNQQYHSNRMETYKASW